MDSNRMKQSKKAYRSNSEGQQHRVGSRKRISSTRCTASSAIEPGQRRRLKTARCTQREKKHQDDEKSFRSSIVFPDDILLEILSWLPAEFVLRYRCLSKSINAGTRAPDFVLKNLRRRQHGLPRGPPLAVFDTHHRHIVNCCRQLSQRRRYKCPTFVEDCDYCFGSANGLLLFGDEYSDSDSVSLFLCNLLTGDMLELPSSSDGFSLSMTSVRLGFTPRTNEYKVVAATLLHSPLGWRVRYNTCAISAETGVPGPWRRTVASLLAVYAKIGSDDPSASAVNGRVHFVWWVLSKGTIITSFDLDDELVRDVPSPLNMEDLGRVSVSGIGGCLSLLQNVLEDDDIYILWVMKEYGVEESWVKAYSFAVEVVYVPRSPSSPDLNYFSLGRMYLDDNGRLLRYDLKKSKYVYSDEKDQVNLDDTPYHVAVPFVGCLVRLRSRGEEDGDY